MIRRPQRSTLFPYRRLFRSLLDLETKRSWADLLPVVGGLDARHLELAAAAHRSGLEVLAAPAGWEPPRDGAAPERLIRGLAALIPWLLLDLPSGLSASNVRVLERCDAALLISTADPPALRAAARAIQSLSPRLRERTGLALNQITSRHPGKQIGRASGRERV